MPCSIDYDICSVWHYTNCFNNPDATRSCVCSASTVPIDGIDPTNGCDGKLKSEKVICF